jgi:hypothetical protein
MQYVFCAFDQMPVRMLSYPRLYAFPRKPDPPGDSFIILDSGAFGLAQRGHEIGERHMARLAEHYAHAQGERIICIAPDVCFNPVNTIANYALWRRKYAHLPVAPVLQPRGPGRVDLYDLRQQVNSYLDYLDVWPRLFGRPFLAVANPSLVGLANGSRGFQFLRRMIQQAVPDVWLHMLGAGWSLPDIIAWRDLDCFDSMDSVAYYEDAKRGVSWQGPPAKAWQETAANNADTIRRALKVLR